MIETEIDSLDLISQLGQETIVSYEAEDATVTTIVTALLALQSLSPAVTLGTISGDYSTLTRSIKVDGDTILRALFRLRDTVGGYLYVDNNRALQWATSIGEDKGQQIRYRKNLIGIERTIDYTQLCNRLYAYGAGEGIEARIKLSDADGQDEDYVEDTTSQGAPPAGWGGIYKRTFVEKSMTHPNTLLAWANLKLADVKDPPITYRVNTLDLSQSEDYDFSFDALQIGSNVKVIDEDIGIDVSVKVVKIEHPDMLHPENMIIELANRTKDIANALLEVYDRQQFDSHVATVIGAGLVTINGTLMITDWISEGQTTINGAKITTGTVTLTTLNFVPLSSSGDTDDIVATINASAEGITINANRINITVGKSVFKQASIPTSLHVGDMWFDTDDDFKLYRADSIGADEITAGEWESVRDSGIADALAAAAGAQETADGEIVGYYQDAEPGAGMTFGDIWIDTDGATPPDSTCIYRYEDVDGGSEGVLAWRAAPTNAIGLVFLSAWGAQATADGKIVTFYQDEIPTSEGIGDLWIDTNDENKLYRAAIAGADEIKVGEWEIARDELIEANAASIVVNADNIALNVTDISVIDGRVTTAEGSIIVNADNIALNVTDISVIDGRVTTAEGSIIVNADNIALNVTDISVIDGRVTTAEGSIIVNADNIALNVTDISVIDGRVTTAEGSIIVNADNIELKVSLDDVINSINISIEGIKIDADNITLDGVVSVTDDLQSSNYVAGVSGWIIDGDGNAEFNNVTVRGNLQAGVGSSIDGGYIVANSITTSELNFTPLYSDDDTGDIIATINASSEGIVIEGDNIEINGLTTFAATSPVIIDIIEDLASDANSGQKDVVLADAAAAAKYAADDVIYLEDDSNGEACTIASIATATLTMIDNLTNTYTTAANACVTKYGAADNINHGVTTIDGGLLQTDTVIADAISVTDLAAINADLGTILAGDIQLGNGNDIGSSFTGIRIYKDGAVYRVAGYSADAVQCYIDSDGKFKSGDGTYITIDVTGMTAKGKAIDFQNSSGTSRGEIYGPAAVDVLFIAATTAIELSKFAYNQGFYVRTNETYSCGSSSYHWTNVAAANFTEYSDAPEIEDPIAAVKKLKTVWKNGKLKKDKESFPSSVVVSPGPSEQAFADKTHAENQAMYKAGFLEKAPVKSNPIEGLSIGGEIWMALLAIQKLIERVEALEARLN